MTLTPLEALKKYWGYDAFRPLQGEIIQSLLDGCDTMALMPTGGGKSICYQVPALIMDGMCIVVSPLISLMKDQVQQLIDRGIKARCLVSGISTPEQDIIINNCITGRVKLLYVSPERLRQRAFRENMRRMSISMIAVDEAHCISQWGYDFRPAYLEIAQIRAYHPQAPIIALTASATPDVVEDIQNKLLFRKNRRFFQTSFYRENIAYMVFHENDKEGKMIRIAQKMGKSGIVYVRNRRRTKELSALLIGQGIPSTYYHAGLDPKERDIAQSRWMKGDVSVIVATNAFGMGIDKPDVRYVIHMDIPSSPEAYFQEAGRAGRDGKKAFAVMLYNEKDLENLQYNFTTEYPSRQLITNIYKAICNYYQIPVGSGENCIFNFDMEGICSTYNINILELFSAAKFLEKEGLISIPDREDSESRLYIPISREDLYRFQVEQIRYSDLLTAVLRMYGGLFSDFTPVSERAIAKRLYMDESTVTRMLAHLDALKIVSYKPKRTKPSIQFTAPRINENDICLSDANYKDLKAKANSRIEAIRNYVINDSQCRSQQLLAYFGETKHNACGICDYCINKKDETSDASLRDSIISLLKAQPMRGDNILAAMNFSDEQKLKSIIRQLVDEEVVSINERLEFFI